MARSDLHRLTGRVGGPNCDDDCPNIYVDTSDGGIVVQGNQCSAFRPPTGEALVKIPEHVLREAVRALGW
ncbi:hypothetical protein [Streptomyces anulatus]|uniref:Uncharacterized protein n=1 Tax=Streptomyces anulatus TaxID=1892 RepID=A0A7K3RK56_STRAQ|nr:hypothetical protein [Streptomyces anulatus]NEC02386.1 hypothetical protein [Streptomyces anulatus]NED29247.1 hypothetical protein [Streptomyces anulatus]